MSLLAICIIAEKSLRRIRIGTETETETDGKIHGEGMEGMDRGGGMMMTDVIIREGTAEMVDIGMEGGKCRRLQLRTVRLINTLRGTNSDIQTDLLST
jgi:hypothetical protein